MVKIISILLCFFSLNIYAQDNIVAEVEIKGLKKTKVSFIQKLIKIEKGSSLDTTLIENDIKRLVYLISIAKADYQIEKISDNNYKVSYLLDENFTLIPQLNIWTVDQVFSYSIGLSEYNLFGENIALGGFYQYNGYHSFGGNFSAPYLFSKKLGLAVNYRNWTSEEPLFFSDFVAYYKYNNESYEVIVLYEFNFKHSINLGVNFFTEKYNYLYRTPSGPIDKIPLAVEENKSMLKFVYKYNNIAYNYYLLSGFKNDFYLQTIVTENDFQNKFFIGWNDFFYYKRFGLKGNFATRLRVGLSTNSDSPFAPFVLDNNVNIRGVGNIIDRGTGSIVWNVEYRQTIIEKNWFVLQMNIFTDAGSWRNPGGSLGDFAKIENMQIYAGGGLRFMHKKIYNAIFRIDYGNSIINHNSGGIVIGVGQYF